MKRKCLCLLLALTLVLGLAANVSAVGADQVTWTVNDGLLTISGTGPMADYAEGQAPWLDEEVYSLIIEDGVTSIGSNAFRGMAELLDAVIGRDVTAIDKTAFNDCPALEDVIFRGNDHIIPSGTFSNCTELSVFRFAGDQPALEAGSLATGYDGVMDDIISVQFNGLNGTWADKKSMQFDPVDPIQYSAYDNYAVESGTCGENLTWQILRTNISYQYNYLVISGSGPMYDYAEGEAPWMPYIKQYYVKALYIVPGVSTIGENAFAKFGLEFAITPGSIREIGAGAFRNNPGMPSFTLSSNIRSVGDYAFSNTDLTNLYFGTKVPELGIGVFKDCAGLVWSNLPEGLTHIPDATFSGCKRLMETTIPTTVTSIGTDAYAGCSGLRTVNFYGTTRQWEAIEIAEGNEKLLSAELKGVLATSGTCGDNARWELSEDYTTLTISGTGAVTSHPWANAARVVETIIVEEGITSLCDGAFYGFEIVTEVRLPETLTAIGASAFRNNYALPALVLPAGLTKLGDNAFTWCSSLKSMVIPEGITAIPEHLLSYCEALESVEMSENVTAIGASAFIRCVSLSQINIPSGLTALGGDAFAGCNSLHIRFEWPETLPYVGTALKASGITEVVLPDTVTTIGAHAFMGCTSLETINIPDSVTSIGERAFETTSSLKSIRIPEGITTIPFSCFSGSGIAELSLPDSLTTIERYAFQRCANLESVHLPDSITSIADEVFSFCSSLAEINWPSGVDNIGWHQFNGTALTEFTVPATVKLVESYAFKDCTKLEKVTFESRDTVVSGSQIFENDPLLTIYCWYDSSAQAAAEFNMVPYVLFDAPADLPRYRVLTTIQGDGTVTATPADSIGFEWVTIDITPASNSVLYDLFLYYYSDEELELRIEAVDEDTFRLLMPKCDVEIVAVFQNTETGFIDIKSADFFYEPVLWAVENGVTTGISDIEFGPNGQCQRAQIVTFLWRAAGCPLVEAENPFTDVKETDFYYDAVLWAVENGITTGTSATTFSPFKTCSRAEVVTFLWRAHGKPGSNAENPFADVKDTDFFHTAVLWAVENGITNGMDATHFGSLNVCNRAQVVTFLYRAKDVPHAAPDGKYTFELKTNDPTEEIGWAFCEGTEFAAGESVVFYAEPWFGYLVEFEAEEELELYYLGACSYELIMPDHDVTLTVNFVPAEGDAHYIRTTCENAEFYALCDVDEEFNDIAKPGEFVQFYVMANEGYTLTPENITLTVGGESWNEWWFLGQVSEPDPELEMGSIFVFETVMPDADLDVSITCTAGDTAAANTFRAPVSVK